MPKSTPKGQEGKKCNHVWRNLDRSTDECINCNRKASQSMMTGEIIFEDGSKDPTPPKEEFGEIISEFDELWPSVRSYTAGQMEEWILKALRSVRQQAIVDCMRNIELGENCTCGNRTLMNLQELLNQSTNDTLSRRL